MPTWNPGSYLAHAVNSILDQTFSDLELVIVDDGSTDGYVDRVLAARPDPRVRLIRNPRNVGIGASYSVAIPTCSSPWIALIDSDDISHPMRLEIQLKALAADPSLDAVAADIEIIDGEGRFVEPYASFHSPRDIKAFALALLPIPHPTLVGRAEMFRSTGYRAKVRSAADYDMVLRALDKGYKIGAVSVTLYSYRRHQASTTSVRHVEHLTFVCMIQICAARRRANREEQLDLLVADADTMIRDRLRLSDIYRRYAHASAAEGQPVLAAVHAAFSLRDRFTLRSLFLLVRSLISAAASDRGSLRPAAAGFFKGGIGVFLQRDMAPER